MWPKHRHKGIVSPCTLRLVVPANPLTGKIRPRRIDASPRHEPAFFVEAVNRPDFADSEPAENDDTLATACEQASEGTLGVKLPQKPREELDREYLRPTAHPGSFPTRHRFERRRRRHSMSTPPNTFPRTKKPNGTGPVEQDRKSADAVKRIGGTLTPSV